MNESICVTKIWKAFINGYCFNSVLSQCFTKKGRVLLTVKKKIWINNKNNDFIILKTLFTITIKGVHLCTTNLVIFLKITFTYFYNFINMFSVSKDLINK